MPYDYDRPPRDDQEIALAFRWVCAQLRIDITTFDFDRTVHALEALDDCYRYAAGSSPRSLVESGYAAAAFLYDTLTRDDSFAAHVVAAYEALEDGRRRPPGVRPDAVALARARYSRRGAECRCYALDCVC